MEGYHKRPCQRKALNRGVAPSLLRKFHTPLLPHSYIWPSPEEVAEAKEDETYTHTPRRSSRSRQAGTTKPEREEEVAARQV